MTVPTHDFRGRFAVWLCLLLGVFPLGAEEKPNVVVFLVDDLGWTDLGCFGSDFYETPNIDQLAEAGLKLEQGYAACTVCSPTRAALLTGRSPARLHLTDFIPGHPIENTSMTMPDWTPVLKLERVTLAERLRPLGYRTAHLGKWHLTYRKRGAPTNLGDGDDPKHYPDRQGFDVNIGGCERGAPPRYFWPYGRGTTLAKRKQNNIYETLPKDRGEEGEYLTDRIAEEAVRLLDRFRDEPFFLHCAFYNVHTPLQGKPGLVDDYRKKRERMPDAVHSNPVYAAMIHSVDEAVGRIVTRLEDLGLREETLIIFTSDNGGLWPQATRNDPLRQGKGSIYEGGVRVPWILSWPGRIRAGAVSQTPVITMDILPTVLELAGQPLPEDLDGVSLRPLFEDPGVDLKRGALHWHYPHYHMMGARPHSVIRQGDWKLIELHETGSLELYDLSKDIHEDRNLAATHPEKAEELLDKLRRWRDRVGAQMPSPNPHYDPSKPTGWMRGDRVREMAALRE